MNWIENQPVFFGSADQCSDDETPVQLVDNTDITQVQFELDKCDDSIQLLPDPNFNDTAAWNEGTNWSIVENTLCHVAGSVVSARSVLQFDPSKYYQINITVDAISNGGSVSVLLGYTLIGTITSTGVYTFYGFPVLFFGLSALSFVPTTTTDICLSEVTAYEIPLNAIVVVHDDEGDYRAEISYNITPGYFHVSKNSMTITINWAELGLTDDCYTLCFLDPCENNNGQNNPPSIDNCGFTGNSEGWGLLENAVYGTNNIIISAADAGTLYQPDVFNNSRSAFCVEINVSAITGNVLVYFGDNLVDTLTTTGVHTVTGIPSGNYTLSIGTTEDSPGSITIESVCACAIDQINYVCNLTSNTFKLGDYTNSCTLLINACNNEDGLGFIFDSGFTPRIRLEAKLRQAKYSSERPVYENSVGNKSVVYFSGRKSKNLCIDLQPEYVHDFLRLLLGFDNVYINNEPYYVEDDEYNVDYSEVSDSVGKVRLLVSKRTQDVKNINYSDDENVCNLPPNYLLQSNNLSQFILLTDGQKILINA